MADSRTDPPMGGSDERPTAELLRDGFRWYAEYLEADNASAGEADLSPGAAMTMSYLDGAPIRSSELGRRMRVSRQRIHTVLNELRAADLVQLIPDPTSRRDKLIQTTAAGERRRRRVRSALQRLDDSVADQLGHEEFARLRRLLDRLIALPRSE